MKDWVRLTNEEDIPLNIERINFDELFEHEEQDLKTIQNDLDPGGKEECWTTRV